VCSFRPFSFHYKSKKEQDGSERDEGQTDEGREFSTLANSPKQKKTRWKRPPSIDEL
jgi:hypothetical protein